MNIEFVLKQKADGLTSTFNQALADVDAFTEAARQAGADPVGVSHIREFVVLAIDGIQATMSECAVKKLAREAPEPTGEELNEWVPIGGAEGDGKA